MSAAHFNDIADNFCGVPRNTVLTRLLFLPLHKQAPSKAGPRRSTTINDITIVGPKVVVPYISRLVGTEDLGHN